MNTLELGKNTNIFEIRDALSSDDCAKIISLFEAHPEDHEEGVTGKGLDPSKKSTDAMIREQLHWKVMDAVLFTSLTTAVAALGERQEFFAGGFNLSDEGYQVQKTGPCEFYHWHFDAAPNLNRVLVALWYLNDIGGEEQGGRTQFKYQDISITPEAGKLILFPPFHTHVHRGEILNYGEKYIATTWLYDL